jgi:hypothetical protein
MYTPQLHARTPGLCARPLAFSRPRFRLTFTVSLRIEATAGSPFRYPRRQMQERTRCFQTETPSSKLSSQMHHTIVTGLFNKSGSNTRRTPTQSIDPELCNALDRALGCSGDPLSAHSIPTWRRLVDMPCFPTRSASFERHFAARESRFLFTWWALAFVVDVFWSCSVLSGGCVARPP